MYAGGSENNLMIYEGLLEQQQKGYATTSLPSLADITVSQNKVWIPNVLPLTFPELHLSLGFSVLMLQGHL